MAGTSFLESTSSSPLVRGGRRNPSEAEGSGDVPPRCSRLTQTPPLARSSTSSQARRRSPTLRTAATRLLNPLIEHDHYFLRSEEHTSELQSHSFISYAVFC